MTDLAPPKAPPGARFADPDNDDFRLLFDLHGDALPSGRTAKVRAWNGHAERALLASLRAPGPARVDHLVRFLLGVLAEIDGVPATEEVVLDLHDSDVRAIQLRARFATHDESPALEFAWDCGPPAVQKGLGCGHRGAGPTGLDGRPPNRQAVRMDALPFLPMEELRPFLLPASKKQAAYFPNTLRRQKAYLAQQRPQQAADDGVDLDALVLARGVQFDGKPVKRADLEDLMGKDRSVLRRELLRWGGVDSRVEARCNGCGVVMKTLVEALPGFFFPEMEAA